jgi:MFS family permease
MPPPGYRRTIAALSLGQIVSWAALYYGFTSFVLPMQRDLGWSRPTLMGAFTLGLAVWGAATYAVGAAIDRGRGRVVMTAGALLAAAGFALWAAAQAPWMLYAAWALLGAAMAMTLYEPVFVVVTQRYPERYRNAITTLTLVGGFASTLSFPAVAALMAAFGWRGALFALAVLMLVLIAPLHWVALAGPARGATPKGHDARADATLREALRERAFWLLALTFTLYSFCVAALWAHAMPALVGKGLSEAQALAVLVWFGPAQVTGRFLFAAAGRGVSLRGIGLVVLCGLPISFALFAFAREVAWLIVFALLFGAANGIVTIVRGGMVPEFFGRAHVGRIGGAMAAIGLFARAAAPLVTAWMLAAMNGYEPLMLWLAGLGVLAVGAFALATPPRHNGRP